MGARGCCRLSNRPNADARQSPRTTPPQSGQPYRLRLSQESETFVVFWSRGLADAAWQAFSSSSDAFPEVPAVSGRSHAALEVALAVLGNEANSEEPQEAALRELSLSALAEV